jgi:hypothetical protein
MRIKRSQKNATVFVVIPLPGGESGDLFIQRHLLELVIHDFTCGTDTFATLFTNRNQLAQMLNRFGLIAADYFAEGFITHGITQADVHLLQAPVHFLIKV